MGSWVLPFFVLAYGVLFVALGASVSCLPCVLVCCRRANVRAAPRKWSLGITTLLVFWTTPVSLWFAYSPLNVCSNRIIYSEAAGGGPSEVWEPFWCSRKCYEARAVYPIDPPNLQEVVADAGHVRAVGGGHSSTELQCNEDTLVVVEDRLCSFDGVDDDGVATFGAGCSVEFALRSLLAEGRQLRGFGGIAQQRLGGAVSTSLHGQHPVPFSQSLVGLTAVLANGSLLTVEESAHLDAWKGSMGRLGVIVRVRLRVWPVEFAVCTSVRGNATDLERALRDPTLIGFEAKRLISQSAYTIRTCHTAPDPGDRVVYEDKNSLWDGFVLDNVALPLVVLFGSTLTRSSWLAGVLLRMNSVATSRAGVVATVNDYRVAVAYNPHFDEEYAVPIAECHRALETIRARFSDLHVHAFLRRVDADTAWLSWAPVDSCALRLEYYDYNRVDFVEFERHFRLVVERIVLQNGGSGHRGKLWYGHASELVPREASDRFEAYRSELDPTSKFENAFTLETKSAGQRLHNSLPFDLQVRAFAYRAFVWVAVAASALVGVLLCATVGRRVRISMVPSVPPPSTTPPPLVPLPSLASSTAKGIIRAREAAIHQRRR